MRETIRRYIASSMATANAPTGLGVFQIFREAIILPKRNFSLIFYVFSIYLITSIFINLINHFSTHSIIMDLVAKSAEIRTVDPKSSIYSQLLVAIIKDIREFASIEVIIILIAVIIQFIMRTITVYAIAITYTNNSSTLKELLCKVKRMLKGPFITQVCVTLLALGYFSLLVFVIWLVWFLFSESILAVIVVTFVCILAVLWYIYLVTFWSLSIVVSVVEDGCYGVGAIKRSEDLIKHRKCRGFSIIFLTLLVVIVIVGIYSLCFNHTKGRQWILLVVELVYILLIQIVMLLFLSALTIYYYECKKGFEYEVSSNIVYTSLPSAEVPYAEELP